jgi:hypothetical protein
VPPARWQSSRAIAGVIFASAGWFIIFIQRLLDASLRDNAQEGRLFQLYRESLAQRPVKYRIIRRIGEVGKHDRVFRRQHLCPASEKPPAAQSQCDNRNCCTTGRDPSRPSGFPGRLLPSPVFQRSWLAHFLRGGLSLLLDDHPRQHGLLGVYLGPFEISEGREFGRVSKAAPRFRCESQRYWRNKAITPFRKSFNIERFFSRVAQSLPQGHDRSVQAMVKVNKSICRPKKLTQLFSRNHSTCMFQEICQDT